MRESIYLSGIAIICLTVLEAIALIIGFDGQAFSLIVGGICALAGYNLQKWTLENKLTNATSLEQLKAEVIK